MTSKIENVFAEHPHLRKKKLNISAMVIEVLRRQATMDSGEQRLAFAIIAQAISDCSDFVKGRPISHADAHTAVMLLRAGGSPWSDLIGLDPEYVIETVCTSAPPGGMSFVDLAERRIRLARAIALAAA